MFPGEKKDARHAIGEGSGNINALGKTSVQKEYYNQYVRLGCSVMERASQHAPLAGGGRVFVVYFMDFYQLKP